MTKESVKLWTCKKCGHVWANRAKKSSPVKPTVCPSCKKYTWDRD